MSSKINFNKVEQGIELSVSAPGKVILHGEHSVVYGKLAVAASLGLRTKIHLVEIDSPNTLIFRILSLGSEHVFNLTDIQRLLLDQSPSVDGNVSNFNWQSPNLLNHKAHIELVDAAISSIISESNDRNVSPIKSLQCLFYLLSGILSSTNVAVSSMCISVDSELEMGAGTGSSASFSVALAAALVHYLKLKSANMENVSRKGFKRFSWDKREVEHLKEFSESQLQAVCSWSFCSEKIFHGTPSGLDNTICTFGGMVNFRKNQQPTLMKLRTSFNILLINTRVPRETSKLIHQVASLRESFPALVNHILDAMDDLSASAIEIISKIDSSRGDCAVSERNFEDLAVLVQMNHSLLASLGVSHPKLEEVVAVLAENGLKGKLTGAGGGGFAISIVPSSYDTEEVVRKLKEHDFGVICTKLGGVGVRVD